MFITWIDEQFGSKKGLNVDHISFYVLEFIEGNDSLSLFMNDGKSIIAVTGQETIKHILDILKPVQLNQVLPVDKITIIDACPDG